jgi:hypothetical protein
MPTQQPNPLEASGNFMKTPPERHRSPWYTAGARGSIAPHEYLISASYLGSCRLLDNAVELALLLENAERSASPATANKYQVIVRQLRRILVRGLPPNDLQCVLEAFPATAELFENIHFQSLGLSRAPLLNAAYAAAMTKRLMATLTLPLAPEEEKK